MADELNIPTHRYYKPKYNVALAKEDISPKYILDSGIRKIDARIGEVEIREPLFSNNEAGVWYDPSQAANLDWRRNLLTFSEQFDNAVWTKSNTTVTANAAVAPDGTNTANLLAENTANAVHLASGSLASLWPDNTSYTASVYVKAAGRSIFWMESRTKTPTFPLVFFDLTSGQVSNTNNGATGSIQSVGDGWYRCALTANSLTGTFFPNIVFGPALVSGTRAYTGDGTSGVYVWGAQLELGSTATEYQRITDLNTEVMERFPEATLFQDTAGTTPVTTAGQTVGLMLDKSKGLVLGSELANAPSQVIRFATGAQSGVGYNIIATGNFAGVRQDAVLTVGKYYKVSVRWSGNDEGRAFVIGNYGGSISIGSSASGSTSAVILAAAVDVGVFFSNSVSGDTFYVEITSVKELAGNHATQATAASRPTYGIVPFGGRRNLLTFSEQFDNAGWAKVGSTVTANSTTAPDGTTTADTIVALATLGQHRVDYVTTIAAGTYTFSCYVKAAGYDFVWLRIGTNQSVVISLIDGSISNLVGGTATATSVGGGWWRLTLSGACLANSTCRINATASSSTSDFTGDGTSGVYIWGAQLEASATATAYQRVTTQYDVTEAGVPPVAYLAFDGVDDGMVTPTITPNIDKVQVFAGVRKLSDAARAMLAEMGSNVAQSFRLEAPNATGSVYYSFTSTGSTAGFAGDTNAARAAPNTSILTGLGDISGDLAILRANGTQVGVSVADQGTGNYLAYPLYIGRRGGTSLPFNGQLYSLIARFGSNLDANDIANTETYVASKTGVTL